MASINDKIETELMTVSRDQLIDELFSQKPSRKKRTRLGEILEQLETRKAEVADVRDISLGENLPSIKGVIIRGWKNGKRVTIIIIFR